MIPLFLAPCQLEFVWINLLVQLLDLIEVPFALNNSFFHCHLAKVLQILLINLAENAPLFIPLEFSFSTHSHFCIF